MAKATDVRPKITLACAECKERNYITRKNRRNDPDRIELKKFCPIAAGTRCTARRADADWLAITYEGAGRGPGRQSEPDSESGRSVLPGLLASRRVCPPA